MIKGNRAAPYCEGGDAVPQGRRCQGRAGRNAQKKRTALLCIVAALLIVAAAGFGIALGLFVGIPDEDEYPQYVDESLQNGRWGRADWVLRKDYGETGSDSLFQGLDDGQKQQLYTYYHISVEDGVLTDYSGDAEHLDIPGYMGITVIGREAFANNHHLEEIILPEGVTELGERAFSGCWFLESIHLPDSLISLGDMALASCDYLSSIVLPDGLHSIGFRAFYGCMSITAMEIPDSVTDIEPCAFWFTSIEEPIITNGGTVLCYVPMDYTSYVIPDTVTTINGAFMSCRELESVTIPDSVTYLGDFSFADCPKLQSLEIPDSVTGAGDSVFDSTPLEEPVLVGGGTVLCYVPTDTVNYVVPDTVISINGAFGGCSELESVVLPEGLTRIGARTFSGCSSLKAIRLPDGVTYIGEFAFFGCKQLTSFTIPDGVSVISDSLFSGCSNLRRIDIPDSVERIGESAFSSCALESIVIPDSVTEIGDSAFYNCESLKVVQLPDYLAQIGACLFRGTALEEPVLANGGTVLCYVPPDYTSYEIPDKVTTINGAFIGCADLTEVTILGSVQVIGKMTFEDCGKLVMVTIEEGTRVIGNYCFSDCDSLETVVIPDSVVWIESLAFPDDCEGLVIRCGGGSFAQGFAEANGITSAIG